MENVLSVQQPESLFRTTYTLAIRIWHWLTFLTITASIIMVILASTMFTMKGNIPVVQQQVQQKGGTLSTDQARAVAHEYSDKLWMTHKYIGFGLCFLLLCRIIIEAAYSRERRLANKIRKALTFKTQNDIQRYDRRHYIWVKWGYVIFYFLFLVMALTGLGLAFEEVPAFSSIHKSLAGIHKVVQFLIYGYIFFHIAGVIRADVTDNKGIVSRMINGGGKA
jgi:Ni/Fe-hydrogenase 1 B-type cytochrome subunit